MSTASRSYAGVSVNWLRMKRPVFYGASATPAEAGAGCATLRSATLAAVLIAVLHAGAAGAETAVVQVVDGDDKPVADAAVFLTASGATTRPSDPERGHASAIMDQIGYQFVPHVLVVRTGTEVAFPN